MIFLHSTRRNIRIRVGARYIDGRMGGWVGERVGVNLGG